jgi:tetratricopeptide (TPR) repeat protein/transcriptional regulator with XRE-family HTH domain
MARVQSPTFGKLLHRYRLAAGLTQEALAEQAGLGARTISDLERGVAHHPQRHTLQLLADALSLSTRDRSRLEAVAAHSLLSTASSELPGDRANVSVPPALVGRTAELEVLEQHVNGAGPPMLMLAGEPGIGKTRLLHEAEQYGTAAGTAVLQGGCQRRSAQEPYAPVVEALASHIDRQSSADVRELLKGCSWLIRLLPELTDVLTAPPSGLHPMQERRLMFRAVIRFLQNVAGPGGVLLVLDDLQWAGTDALDLTATLVRCSAEVPPRLIGAYRDTEIGPEDELSIMLADLARSDLTMHRSLGPLLPEEATTLLSTLVTGVDRAGTKVEEQVVQRSGGVPFFLVSYAQGLREGSLDLSAGRTTPWTTAQSIRQRVVSLSDDARHVLNVAAIAGRVVPQALVIAVAGQEEAAVVAGLDAACKARLLEAQPRHTYRFTHDLIREVIEADLGAAQRTLLHRRIGQALEQVPDQQRGRNVTELAWHFREGDEPERALPYTIRAGDQAEAVYAHSEAEHHYRTALELAQQLGDTSRQAEALEKLGFVLFRMCRLTESHEVSKQAIELYHAVGDLEGEGWALTRMAGVRESPDEGIARIQPLLDRLQARGPSPILIRLHENMAFLLSNNGQYKESLAVAERGCELARTLEDKCLLVGPEHVRGHVLVQLGHTQAGLEVLREHQNNWGSLRFAGDAYTVLGQLDEARLCFERALAMVEQIGEPATLAHHLGMLSSYLCLLGECRQARAHIDAAEAIVRSVEMQWDEPLALCLRVRGQLCLAEGRWADASSYLEECITVCERPGNVKRLAQAHMVLAELHLLQGHADLVRTRLEIVLERSDLSAADVTGLLPLLAWAHLEMNNPLTAETLVELAVKRATTSGMRLYLVDALRVKGMIERHRRHWQKAEGTFKDVLEMAQTLRYVRAEGWILYESGLNQHDEGNRQVARQRWEEALAIFRHVSLRPLIERTEQALTLIR